MVHRRLIFSIALLTVLGTASVPAAAQWKYPDWSGRWTDLNTNRRDPSKPPNAGQQAPLIPEYQVIDGSGIPLLEDNQTIIRERMSLDKGNADRLLDEITLVDHAFTRPWTVTRGYMRQRNPAWAEYDCHENNEHVIVGSEAYLISADGYLMPTRKDQPPPDARYFRKPEKVMPIRIGSQ